MPSGWPDWQRPGPVEAVVGTVVGADPAASAQWSVTVPAGETWAVMAIRAVFVTVAVAANRVVVVEVARGATLLLSMPGAGVSTSGQINEYDWIRGVSAGYSVLAAFGFYSVQPLWEFWLQGGDVVRSAVGGMQGGDDWGAPVISRAFLGA